MDSSSIPALRHTARGRLIKKSEDDLWFKRSTCMMVNNLADTFLLECATVVDFIRFLRGSALGPTLTGSYSIG